MGKQIKLYIEIKALGSYGVIDEEKCIEYFKKHNYSILDFYSDEMEQDYHFISIVPLNKIIAIRNYMRTHYKDYGTKIHLKKCNEDNIDYKLRIINIVLD